MSSIVHSRHRNVHRGPEDSFSWLPDEQPVCPQYASTPSLIEPINGSIANIDILDDFEQDHYEKYSTRRDVAQEKQIPVKSLIFDSSPHAFPQLLQESDLECPLCYRLLFQPVTTICGHSYCKNCLSLALAFNPSCPLCRRHLHFEASSTSSTDYSVSFVLSLLIEKSFPEQYKARQIESEEEEKNQKNQEKMPEKHTTSQSAPESYGRYIRANELDYGLQRKNSQLMIEFKTKNYNDANKNESNIDNIGYYLVEMSSCRIKDGVHRMFGLIAGALAVE